MFIGHFGLGLGGKKLCKRPSLAMLFIAAQFLDLLWPLFVLFGIESFSIVVGDTAMTPLHFSNYPWSHSLFMAIVWGITLAVIYFACTKNKTGAMVISGLVVSHWVLDFLTHTEDLPLTPFSDTKVGLGLWNYPLLAIPLELALYGAGVYLYYKIVRPRKKKTFWGLVIFLLIVYFANVFGPPPPSVTAVAWSANLMWLIVLFAWWLERDTKKEQLTTTPL